MLEYFKAVSQLRLATLAVTTENMSAFGPKHSHRQLHCTCRLLEVKTKRTSSWHQLIGGSRKRRSRGLFPTPDTNKTRALAFHQAAKFLAGLFGIKMSRHD
jgi:hypothetical protein